MKDQMERRDFTVAAIHEELDPHEFDLTVREFGSGSCRVLLSTDLRVGGVQDSASLVINYFLPRAPETYLRRCRGSAAQFGRKGVVINLVTNEDIQAMKEIERHYHTQIEEMPLNIADLI